MNFILGSFGAADSVMWVSGNASLEMDEEGRGRAISAHRRASALIGLNRTFAFLLPPQTRLHLFSAPLVYPTITDNLRYKLVGWQSHSDLPANPKHLE
jgi:hypothetical protein